VEDTQDSYLQTVAVGVHSSPLMPFGLAEIGIAPPGKKDWKVTPAGGTRRRKTAVERFSSACAWYLNETILADESETVRPYVA